MRFNQNLRVFWKPVHKTAYGRISSKLPWGPYCRKRGQFIATLQFGTQIYSYASSNEDTRRKRKLEKIPAWDPEKKSETNQRWSMNKDEGHKSSFCLTDGHLPFEECRIGDKAPKIQRSNCTPRRHCKRWFWILCSIYRIRIISITNDYSKNHGHHIQTARMRRTSSGRSICLYPGQHERCSKIIENPKIGMSRHLDSSTTTQMAQIMVQYGRPSRSSWAGICMVILWQDCYGKGNLRKFYWNTVAKSFQLGMLIRTPWKRVILICVCGWHQIG